jgi:TRAP-type uncharacterized transport system fused permease subunit
MIGSDSHRVVGWFLPFVIIIYVWLCSLFILCEYKKTKRKGQTNEDCLEELGKIILSFYDVLLICARVGIVQKQEGP